MITRRRFLEGCARCAAAWPIALSPLAALLGRDAARAQSGASGVTPAEADRWTRSVCDLCGLGEPVFVRTTGGAISAVKGIPQSRTGYGRLCPRARALVAAAGTADRAALPLIRRDPGTKGTLEGLEPASWDEALAAVATGLGSVRARVGPGGVAIVASDAETCETYEALARFARVTLGTDHLDTPARLDALPAYDACEAVFGVAANPASVEDIDAAKLVILIGGDVADSHPGLYTRVLDVRRTGRAKVVLVDSRRTLAASLADVHLRAQPGHEVVVVNALAAALAATGGLDAESAPWSAWLRRDGTAGLATAGASREEIERVAAMWREARSVVTLVGSVALGTYSGATLARAVAQLHRASGQWGAAGRGCLMLPRGGNATGVVAAGIRPGRLPAGARLDVAADRARIAAAWGVGADALPESAGRSLTEWPEAIRDGRIGAILALRANIAAELPDAGAWRHALTTAFTVAATTHVPTETTVFADVVLPLALVTGESAGTMMTLDRRVQQLGVAAAGPGEARDAERLLGELAAAVTGTAPPPFPPAPEARTGWERWQALAHGTPYAADGITPARLRVELDVAWPCRAENAPGTVRLDAATVTSAPVWAPTPRPTRSGPASAEGTLLLVVGPLAGHERSRVRTGRTPELHYEAPSPRLEMHPDDARALGLADGEWVAMSSEIGTATARLWITDRVMPGVVFLPEHYGFLSDLQGGSATQGEPEGLAALVVAGAPAGLPAAVSVRKARRRDMRRRGL